ncbi:pyrroloquinoline quinone-dependent dehydrogenase [Phenylobacterium montanum]|uniref:Pyrroloquinoline quinone-dependent dehydrogenase n=1 Tax=Phenylobacterium montanum TaxID=2823693 RepID=A0A975ITC9_9CAUL|nr:pyrroloquinoline quinone-dependent dehydrogenase [Caulobacter sp. S6]QUD86732.1 pyrroloquinoline quinone-dependent dehydrogenase [Caulobacter sp. S6]
MKATLFGGLAAALFATTALAQTAAPATGDVEWTTYAGDLSGSRYKPLDQINAANFSKLEVAWRFKTDSLGNRPEFKLEGTPLEVGGVLYTTAGTRRAVIALDAATGELLWVHGEHEGARGAAAPRQLSGRGLAYWSDGDEKRILYVTPGYRLIALDAKTGQPVPGFGDHGVVDLKLDFDQTIRPDITTGEAGLHATPLVVGDKVIVGTAFREGFTPEHMNNNKGYVRCFDVHTGKRLWTFHTIPKKGEFGYDTWLKGSADTTGNTAVWTQMSADPALNLVYLPVESPTSDFYGGQRPGAGLFGDSIVAVDLTTGERKWHFQQIHHEIWDYDNSSAPLLMDITVGGKPIKALAQPTKQGFLYVFDRTTGKPVWPMPETAVPKGDVPGEWYAPTQPIPTKPKAYTRNGVSEADLIDFTPDLHKKAMEVVKNYKMGPVFTPPVVSKLPGPLGTLNMSASGGTNWPGGSFDPETHIAYVYACNSCIESIGMQKPPPGMSDIDWVVGEAGQAVQMIRGPGENAGADAPPPSKIPTGGGYHTLNVDGLPILKPPYSTISAINLDTGDILWQIPHGETPDFVRNNPVLKGLNVPRTGQTGYTIGTLVTKSLVIAGDSMVTTTPEHPRGAMLRAYDKTNGKEVGTVWMPAPQSGSPMTYTVNGRQFLVVAVSGGNYSGEYIAYALPAADK